MKKLFLVLSFLAISYGSAEALEIQNTSPRPLKVIFQNPATRQQFSLTAQPGNHNYTIEPMVQRVQKDMQERNVKRQFIKVGIGTFQHQCSGEIIVDKETNSQNLNKAVKITFLNGRCQVWQSK